MRRKVVHLGLGSNVGDKVDNCLRALEAVSTSVYNQIQTVSSFYKTEPIGYQDQDWFINCAVAVSTVLEPHSLHNFLLGIEMQMGRITPFRMGPRIIDIDILLYGLEVIQDKDLIIPHPRLHERGFVLIPLAEIAPDLYHPLLNKTVNELLKKIDREGVNIYTNPPSYTVRL